MNGERTDQLGQLKATLVGSSSPKRGILLCHGYGAPGTDLVPLANAFMQANPRLRDTACFVFPEAPLKLDMGMPWMDSRAWWHIDVGRFERAMRTGNVRALTRDTPGGLDAARGLLEEALHEASHKLGIPLSQWVLGGFSQGAMLTTDLALRMQEGPSALCALSGTLVHESIWKKLAASRSALPIFQSHGVADPILPFQVSEWLRDMLEEAGHTVDFHSFQGGHEIPMSVLRAMGKFLG